MKRIAKNSLLCALFSFAFLFSCLSFTTPYNANGDANYNKFTKIQIGMSEGQVLNILGFPSRKKIDSMTPRKESWYYITPGIDGALTRIQFFAGSVSDISRTDEPMPNEIYNQMPSQEADRYDVNKVLSGMSEGDVLSLAGQPQYTAYDVSPINGGHPTKSWYYIDNNYGYVLRVQFVNGRVIGVTRDQM